MKQLNEKDIIRHYLLNLLTVLNIEISNFDIKKGEKSKIDDLIGVASVLIANENIFLNDKSNLFIQEVSLTDLIELNCEILKNSIEKQKISVKLPANNLIIKVDKYYFSEALKYLLKEIIKNTKKIEFEIDPKKRILIINHNKNSFPSTKGNIIDLLKSKNFKKDDVTFQLALTILNLHKIKYEIQKNKVSLHL